MRKPNCNGVQGDQVDLTQVPAAELGDDVQECVNLQRTFKTVGLELMAGRVPLGQANSVARYLEGQLKSIRAREKSVVVICDVAQLASNGRESERQKQLDEIARLAAAARDAN